MSKATKFSLAATFLSITCALSAQDLPDQQWLCIGEQVLDWALGETPTLSDPRLTKPNTFIVNPSKGYRRLESDSLHGTCELKGQLQGLFWCASTFGYADYSTLEFNTESKFFRYSAGHPGLEYAVLGRCTRFDG